MLGKEKHTELRNLGFQFRCLVRKYLQSSISEGIPFFKLRHCNLEEETPFFQFKMHGTGRPTQIWTYVNSQRFEELKIIHAMDTRPLEVNSLLTSYGMYRPLFLISRFLSAIKATSGENACLVLPLGI